MELTRYRCASGKIKPLDPENETEVTEGKLRLDSQDGRFLLADAFTGPPASESDQDDQNTNDD